jgi:drug/metabolite transporter (DMT)-like permease
MIALSPPANTASRGRVWAAYAAVYLIWGSTYLAIRFAVETMPPLLMAGSRFIMAGTLLYTGLRLAGIATPTVSQWANAAVIGVLLIAVPNGGVCWAEQFVASGLVALVIAITPVFFAVVNWLRPGGERPSGQTSLGIFMGLGGVTWLVGSRQSLAGMPLNHTAIAVVLIACLAVAIGSHYSRHTPKPKSTLMAVAAQMLCGGVLLLCTGLLTRETTVLDVTHITRRSILAFLYLVVFGSLVAFSSFSWLLKVSTPSRVATYAYVNPVIAVFVGWSMGGELLTPSILWSATVIILGVIIITSPPNSLPKLLRSTRMKLGSPLSPVAND